MHYYKERCCIGCIEEPDCIGELDCIAGPDCIGELSCRMVEHCKLEQDLKKRKMC